MASQGPCFCLDAISFGFNIFIHSLLFPFISLLILFIICPYLQAWQSNLHSGSADRWRNDPFPTPPSPTPLLLSFISSSPNSNETWLTARCISSCHSNLPILTTSTFSLQRTLSLCHNISHSFHNTAFPLQIIEKETVRKGKFENKGAPKAVGMLSLLPSLPFPSHSLPVSRPFASFILPTADNDLPTPMVCLFHPSWLIKDYRTVCTATYSMGSSLPLSHTFTLSLSLRLFFPGFSLFFFSSCCSKNSHSAPLLFTKSQSTVKFLHSNVA